MRSQKNYSILPLTKHDIPQVEEFVKKATMVAPSSSLDSVASSQGSGTTDSPRKRREYPRTKDRRRYRTGSPSATPVATELSSPSIAANSTPIPARPPPSPHSKLNFSSDSISISRANHHSPLVPVVSKGVHPGQNHKSPSYGKPPVAPSITKSPSNGSSTASKHLRRTKSSISRTNSMLSKSSCRSATSGSTILSLDHRHDSTTSSHRETFYVRVCLGYLTGIRVSEFKKGKHSSNNLVVGYAALAKSGKRLALSQPIAPNITQNRSSKSHKLYWTNPKRDKSSGLPKRKLMFSLKLERELDRESTKTEEDSIHSHSEYCPEVVKIVIGLKCGDEIYPLGLVNLVINGNEILGQKVDLAIRPFDDAPKAVAKSKRGYLSKRSQTVSFRNHGYDYRLASNATLRARIDVTKGPPGAKKDQLWNDGDDGSSYITHVTLDTRGTARSSDRLGASNSASTMPPYLHVIIDSQRTDCNAVSHEPRWDAREPIDEATADKFPLRYVAIEGIGLEDDRSTLSSVTSPMSGLFYPWTCFSICGEPIFEAQNQIESGYELYDELPSWNVANHQDSKEQEATESSRSPLETSPSGGERSDFSASHLDQSKMIVKIESGPQHSEERLNHEVDDRSHRSTPENSSFQLTEDAYKDLKEAQAKIRWYAKKVGVDVDDLLDCEKEEMQAGDKKNS